MHFSSSPDLPNHQSALTSEVGVNPGIRKELAEQLITPEAARRTCAASSIKGNES